MIAVSYTHLYGFDPRLSSWSPYHGAVYAVVSSVAKIVAAGGDYSRIRFTFQEYFRRMNENPSRSVSYTHLDVYKRQAELIRSSA